MPRRLMPVMSTVSVTRDAKVGGLLALLRHKRLIVTLAQLRVWQAVGNVQTLDLVLPASKGGRQMYGRQKSLGIQGNRATNCSS